MLSAQEETNMPEKPTKEIVKEDAKIEKIEQENVDIKPANTENQVDSGDSDAIQIAAEAELAERAHEVPVLMEEGKKAFKAGQWEDAVGKFGEASGILAVVSGLECLEYAESLVLYGRALCKNAVQSAGLVDNKNVDKKTVPVEEAEAAPVNARFHFGGDGEEEDDEDDEEEPEIETDETNDDFTLAWEAFEHARIIYEKDSSDGSRYKLAEVFMHMGDVCLEDDNTDQGIEVYLQALKLKEELLKPDNRELAEVHHLLGLAYENAGQIETAIEHIEKAKQVLQKRVDVLKQGIEARGGDVKGKGRADDVTIADNDEIKEIQEIMPDLEAKIEDLKSLRDQQEEADKAAQAEKIGASILQQNPSAPVNDLTGLVVKKRKAPEDVPKEEESEKRPKQE